MTLNYHISSLPFYTYAMDNKLVDELLELRKSCMGKGIVYIVIPNDPMDTKIGVITPKSIFSTQELDDFLQFIISSSDFIGKLKYGHPVWQSVIKRPRKKTFYGMKLSDSSIEMTAIPLEDLIKRGKNSAEDA